VREADRVLAESGAEIRGGAWQATVLEWFTEDEREQEELAGYMAAHEDKLGIRWARDLLRLRIFVEGDDHEAVLTHYDRAMARYPRCVVVELGVAALLAHHSTDWWRTRSILLYVVEQWPGHAGPCHDLGLLHYLLGDFPGALAWYDKAIARLVEDEVDLGAQVYLNRAVTHLAMGGDRKTAIAGVRRALLLKPDYDQAQTALRAMRGKVRWTLW
jgi:tetratricopeptide (TPR) repeat protein